MNDSKSFQLNKDDIKKILKGLAIALAGAGCTYLLGIFNAIDVQYDTPIWVAAMSAILNALQVWIRGQSK